MKVKLLKSHNGYKKDDVISVDTVTGQNLIDGGTAKRAEIKDFIRPQSFYNKIVRK